MVAGDSGYKVVSLGTSLMAQWLGCWASTAGDMGSIPSQGIKSLYPSCHATWAKGKKKVLEWQWACVCLHRAGREMRIKKNKLWGARKNFKPREGPSFSGSSVASGG